MCGILGVRVLINEKNKIFCKSLMEELKIRGTHSFGICCYKNKYFLRKSLKEKFDEFLNFIEGTDGFIYHNRYSTSGDWNVINNNQPILVNKIGAIAMNGILTMSTKEEYEKKFNVKCESDNDAEVFLRRIEKGEEIEQILERESDCSFAGIFLIKNEIFGIRNNKRPLYYYNDSSGNYIISTIDTIRRAGGKWRNAKIIKPYERCYI